MRKVIVLEHISIDGVIQAPGGPEEDPSGGFKYGGWISSYSDEIIGTCGLNRIDYGKKQAEIGYDLGRPFWKKGLMTEALCLLLEKAFEEFHIQEIEAKVDPNNKDSITLLKKFSFQLEEAYESNDCTCLYTVNKEKVSAILSGRSKGKK